MDDIRPTTDDLARDLLADLAWLSDPEAGLWAVGESAWVDQAATVGRAAIRRALAAEAECDWLAAEVARLRGLIGDDGRGWAD